MKMTKSLQSAADNRIVIGRAGAVHGIRGDIRVTPLTDFPDRFETLSQVYVGEELLDIDSVKYHKQFVILHFKQYTVREEAARLTGKMLTIDRSMAAPLPEGEYYTFDIIGLEVFDTEGNALGKVTNVLKTGSNDVYAVKRADSPDLMVPALKKVVKEIDVPGSRMVVDMNQMEEV